MSQSPNVYGADGGELFDLGQGKLWLGFVVRSVRRHLLPFLLTVSLVVGLGILLALTGAKQYITGSTLRAARNDAALLNVTNPGAGTDPTQETPAELAPSVIKSQRFLEEVVDELKLVERRNVGETRLGAFKRSLSEAIFSKPTPEELRRNAADKLRGALVVDLEPTERNKQSVKLGVIWEDPDIAKAIIDTVGRKFIKQSGENEIKALTTARENLNTQLARQKQKVVKLRNELGITEFDQGAIPESSPLRAALGLSDTLEQRVLDADTLLKSTASQLNSRYAIPIPAERPIAPISGGLSSLLIPLIAGAMVGALVTTLLDLLRGRVVEPWQITRRLGLPLLADLKG